MSTTLAGSWELIPHTRLTCPALIQGNALLKGNACCEKYRLIKKCEHWIQKDYYPSNLGEVLYIMEGVDAPPKVL